MILARCPACSTTFRVRPEQLSARHGRVRCGHCQHAFNALENQIEEEALADDLQAEPAKGPVGSAVASLFVLQEKLPDSADALTHSTPEAVATEDSSLPDALAPEDTLPPASASTLGDETPITEAPAQPPADDVLDAPAFITFEDEPPPPSSVAPIIPEIPEERLEPVGEIRLEALDEEPETDLQPAIEAPSQAALQADEALDRDELEDEYEADPDMGTPVAPFQFKPDWPDASELDLKNPPDPSLVEHGPLDFDSLLHKKVVDDTPGMPQQALDQGTSEAAAAERPAAGLPIEAPTASTKADEPELDQDEREPFVEDIEEPTASSPLQQAAWAAGATLLVLALLAQCVLVFRSEIAQSSPQMRLFMESVCAGMGCELPLPRDSASITIESSDIQPDANREAFFTLHTTLRNRAEFAQTWPYLEITLTDARDKALVRRVLEPKQWLPADMPPDAFPARKEVAAQVRFEAPGVAAAGYRVYAFYP